MENNWLGDLFVYIFEVNVIVPYSGTIFQITDTVLSKAVPLSFAHEVGMGYERYKGHILL